MRINMSLRPEFEELYNEFANSHNGVELLRIEGIAPDQLDVGQLSYDFFNNKLANIASDSNSNANQNMSPTEFRTFIANGQMKLLGYHQLWHYSEKRYGRKFADYALSLIWNGGIYFHDAHGVKIQMPYCYAFSLTSMIVDGRPYGPSPNKPARHKKSFLSQVDKLISDLSKQFAGAVAPSDFFLWYAYYAYNEGLGFDNYEDIKEMIQDFEGLVCLLNEPSRAEGESPFTNFGVYDEIGLENLFGHIYYPDGTRPNMDYLMKIQQLFMDWFSNGDPMTGFPYRFPVVTVNLTTDEHNDFIDENFARFVARVDRKKGNFNIHFGDKAKLAMCCRYENDLADMNMSPDSFGNGGVNIGSHRVVTINTCRTALLANGDHDKLYDLIDEYMEVARKLLIVHRYDILDKRIKQNPGYLQFFGSLKWFKLDTMFSTFGITGVNETTEFSGYDILDEDGTDFTMDTLQHIRDNVKRYRLEDGIVYNIEEIPGEQTCVALLNKDKIIFGDDPRIKDKHLYSNQYIPLVNNADIPTRIDLSGRFMKMVSGGGILHLNVDAPVDSDEKMYELLRLAAKSGVNHLAICHRFGKCEDGHVNIIGQARTCPICGKPIMEAVNRVIGYYSKEKNWHPVRQEHDAELRFFS